MTPIYMSAQMMDADRADGGLRDAALHLDFYGRLLTDKQAEILEMYYCEDYSLSELAGGLGISKQAAHDALRNGSRAMAAYEGKLGLVRRHRDYMAYYAESFGVIGELREAIAAANNAVKSGNGAVGRGIPDAPPSMSERLDSMRGIVDRLEASLKRAYQDSVK